MVVEGEPASITILAIDPGFGRTGWAVVNYDPNSKTTVVIATGTLSGDVLFRRRKEIKHLFSKSFCTLDAYEEEFSEMMQKYMPDYVACEGAFYHKFPAAIISLTLMIHVLQRASYAVLKRDIHKVAPMQTKKSVSGSGNADKDLIKASLLKDPSVVFGSNSHPDSLSEHEYDAVAHAVCFSRVLLPEITAKA